MGESYSSYNIVSHLQFKGYFWWLCMVTSPSTRTLLLYQDENSRRSLAFEIFIGYEHVDHVELLELESSVMTYRA